MMHYRNMDAGFRLTLTLTLLIFRSILHFQTWAHLFQSGILFSNDPRGDRPLPENLNKGDVTPTELEDNSRSNGKSDKMTSDMGSEKEVLKKITKLPYKRKHRNLRKHRKSWKKIKRGENSTRRPKRQDEEMNQKFDYVNSSGHYSAPLTESETNILGEFSNLSKSSNGTDLDIDDTLIFDLVNLLSKDPNPSISTTGPSIASRVTNPSSGDGTGVKGSRTFGRMEINMDNGTIRGGILEINSREVYTFYGIPYAVPPIDKLRFRRPFPPKPIHGVFDGTTMQPPCFPTRHERTSRSAAYSKPEMDANFTVEASEDCLYLNIWLPSTVKKEMLPVLVWVHGEGFLSGIKEEDFESVAWFAQKSEIIVVAIQYRLGVFGFLHMDAPEAPRNVGLLDQIQALKWIQRYIGAFGGNPNAVTLIGHDIGAGMVGFHLLSKNRAMYFNRAVMLGGAPTQPQVFKHREETYQTSVEFATKLGCVNKSVSSTLNCLLKLPSASIWNLQSIFTPTSDNALAHPFVPTNDDVLLDASPIKLLENGKGKRTEILIGGTSNEGSSLLLENVERIRPDGPTAICQHNFKSIVDQVFRNFSKLEIAAILHEYKNWDNLEDGFANQLRIAEILGDYYVTCPMRKFSDLWAAQGLIAYHYEFSHQSTALNRPQWMGTAHGDEIDFLFGVPLRLPDKFTKEEVHLSTKAMKMLQTFIKTGKPGMPWEKYDMGGTTHYLKLDGASSASSSNPFLGPRQKACSFWNEMLPLMRRKFGGA